MAQTQKQKTAVQLAQDRLAEVQSRLTAAKQRHDKAIASALELKELMARTKLEIADGTYELLCEEESQLTANIQYLKRTEKH